MTHRARWIGVLGALLLSIPGCVHHTPTEVHYQPVDLKSRTDLVGLVARQFGFERGTPPPFAIPTHVAFAWVRDTRAFPQHYGTDLGRLSGPERLALSDVLEARLSSPPFTPVTRIPAPAVAGGPTPLATPSMPVASATRRAVHTARRLGAEVVVIVQTRTEESLRRNVLWPLSQVDPTGKAVPGRDLVVHARAEACAIWVKRGWLLQCDEASAERMQPWVGPLQQAVLFSELREEAIEEALVAVADAMVGVLLPFTDPPEMHPDDPETTEAPGEPMDEPVEPLAPGPAETIAATP